MRFKFVCVGGTFDLFHKGHEKLVTRAFSLGEKVLIGITGDGFKKDHETESYKKRYSSLVNFLTKKGFISRAVIQEINDPYSSAMIADLQVIVVSEETRPVAERLNQMRKGRGLKPLKIIQISWVRAENGSIICSTDIRKKIMDRQGKLLEKS